jgi:CDP-diglyceride synthetase
MDSYDKTLLGVIGAIALVVVTLIVASFWYYKTTTIAYIEHGYTRAAVPGEAGAQWVKP